MFLFPSLSDAPTYLAQDKICLKAQIDKSLAARLIRKANYCSYSCIFPKDGCDQIDDFTNIIENDAVVTGLADDDIRKEVLGWESLYD